MRHRGFTLIELLTVISIIALLSGLIFGGLSLLNRQKRVIVVTNQFDQLTAAVDGYLARYRMLGDSAAAFSAAPYEFLVRRASATQDGSYLDIPKTWLGKGVDGEPATPADATCIIDVFKRPLQWEVVNEAGLGGRLHTSRVRITCSWDTPADTTDDRWVEWKLTGNGWLKGP